MIILEPHIRVIRKGDPNYKGGVFELTTPMRYLWQRKECVIEIPAGTRTDFASIPRMARPLIPVNGAHRLAAILHDYLYYCAGSVTALATVDNSTGDITQPNRVTFLEYTRKEADQEFKLAMRVEGVGTVKAAAMYRAVRIGGWVFFNSRRRELGKSTPAE